MRDTIAPEPANGNLENQEDINQSTNNSQSSSTDPAEEPVIEEDTEATAGTVYPQKWATGDGTAENPWANNCIQTAYDNTPIGGTIFLRAGYYQMDSQLSILKQINIIGEGMNKTIIVTGDNKSFLVNADHVSIKSLTVDGDAMTDAVEIALFTLIACDYVILENVEIKNGGYYGLNILETSYSSFQNIHAHDNYRHGIHFGAPVEDSVENCYNTYRDIYCWDNGVCGFDGSGQLNNDVLLPSYNIYDSIYAWDNGSHGICLALETHVSLTNSRAWDNGSGGITFQIVNNSTIDNCFTHSNDASGIYIMYSEGISLSNVISKNNGAPGGHTFCGMFVQDSPSTKISNSQFYDDQIEMIQSYGLWLAGTTEYDIEITNCKLTPNLNGGICNSVGAVITITETKLARFYQL